MLKRTLLSLSVILAIAVSAVAAPRHRKPSEAPTPPYIVKTDLNPKLDGKEVEMAFQIEGTYMIDGSVPLGQFPTFGIQPVQERGAPRFSVTVSGDLADLMNRFGMLGPNQKDAKGRVLQATGKITVFPAPKNSPNQGPSYQLNLRDWKRFRIVPPPKP